MWTDEITVDAEEDEEDDLSEADESSGSTADQGGR
jgi:hypothetical protein